MATIPKNKQNIKGKREYIVNNSVPGFKIITTPAKPIIIATHLNTLITSLSIIIEKIVAKTGAAKVIVMASAIGKYLTAKKIHNIPKVPIKALAKCSFNFLV